MFTDTKNLEVTFRENMAEEVEERELELENIVGNLMIRQFQVDRLRLRLIERIDGFRFKIKKKTSSVHMLQHNDKWYKLSIIIDELSVDKFEEEMSS
jgi:hypothetical protein